MDEKATEKLDVPQQCRVAIIGNSNSIHGQSYVFSLVGTPGIKIFNRSIGSTTSLLLLDFLTIEQSLSYDFIIFETAVCDHVNNYLWPSHRVREALEFFISYVRRHSRAHLILLLIPTKMGLLDPNQRSTERLYREVAAENGVPTFDGFDLIRELVGRPQIRLLSGFQRQAKDLCAAFGLPDHLWETMAWRNLRDRNVPSNAAGVFGFNDHLHFSHAVHSYIGGVLKEYILRHRQADLLPSYGEETEAGSPLIVAVRPVGGKPLSRTSSLISRDLQSLNLDDTAIYQCPAGYKALGLMVNISATSCFLDMKGEAATHCLDLHFGPQPFKWLARVVPVPEEVGNGVVKATILSNDLAQDQGRTVRGEVDRGVAEIGELILVRSDWRSSLCQTQNGLKDFERIESLPWAKTMMDEAIAYIDSTVRSIEEQGTFLDAAYDRLITDLLAGNSESMSDAARAKILFLMGKNKELEEFLSRRCREHPDDTELNSMLSGLRSSGAERPGEREALLQRARSAAQAGNDHEAEELYQQGMGLFSDEVRFWFEHASLAQSRRDWGEALQRWEMMRELFPYHESWAVGLFTCLRALGRLEDAELAIELVIARHPKFDDAAAVHATIAADRNDLEEATRRATSVRQRFPGHARNRRFLIELLIRQTAFEKARQELCALVSEGLGSDELVPIAVSLAQTPLGIGWLAAIWEPLALSVTDKNALRRHAAHLYSRFNPVYDCRFLNAWLPNAEILPA